jgi:hypothetical protein
VEPWIARYGSVRDGFQEARDECPGTDKQSEVGVDLAG